MSLVLSRKTLPQKALISCRRESARLLCDSLPDSFLAFESHSETSPRIRGSDRFLPRTSYQTFDQIECECVVLVESRDTLLPCFASLFQP